MRPGLLKLCLFSVLSLSLAATAGSTKKRRAWITIGDAAFRKVQTVAPEAVSIGSRQVRVADISEKVHAVVLDDSRLLAVIGAIHQQMGQCGGFMYHASEAEARAALEARRVALPTPAYGIDQRDVVVPMLAGMQEQHIASTIQALSGYTNRYYARAASTRQTGCWPPGASWQLAAGISRLPLSRTRLIPSRLSP